MRVLVTGSSGSLGRVLLQRLQAAGYDCVEFDLAHGQDVRDAGAVRAATEGCQAALHLAALLIEADPSELMATNLLGTWNVLTGAQEAGLKRVVFLSSANALGVFQGDRLPDYLPLDDDHRCYAHRPYALSKRLGEEMCRAFSEETGTATICLRPPAILDAEARERLRARRRADPVAEWTPFWEYGAFLDINDAAEATLRALECEASGHQSLLLCAADISATQPTLEMVRQLCPDVEWRGGEAYEQEPHRALVDVSRAREMLDWKPHVAWREIQASEPAFVKRQSDARRASGASGDFASTAPSAPRRSQTSAFLQRSERGSISRRQRSDSGGPLRNELVHGHIDTP